ISDETSHWTKIRLLLPPPGYGDAVFFSIPVHEAGYLTIFEVTYIGLGRNPLRHSLQTAQQLSSGTGKIVRNQHPRAFNQQEGRCVAISAGIPFNCRGDGFAFTLDRS